MTWDEEIESWGFKYVADFAERYVDGNGISIMAFEDDEFEIAWMEDGVCGIQEKTCQGLSETKEIVDELRKKLK